MTNCSEISSTFKNKRVLVAGGTGMVGIQLVKLLIEQGARVRVASMDDPSLAHPDIEEFVGSDLRIYSNCGKACEEMDMVFNLLGAKGSPSTAGKYPATSFYNNLMLGIQLTQAACQCHVPKFLYTSTNGVYAPTRLMKEDEMWDKPPSPHDKGPAWAKRMGEMFSELCQIEHKTQFTIVRPSNIYGPYDNFDSENAMVIPSLIKKAIIAAKNGTPMEIWGDGSPKRDFIHAHDVAKGMMLAIEKAPGQVLNISSGVGTSIRTLVKIILRNMEKHVEIKWDSSKPSGDQERVLDNTRLSSLGFKREISLENGIAETISWYLANRNNLSKRFNVFDEG